MAFYTRPQLALLLALLTAAAVGIAVGRWRDAHPDVVDRLEAFDRAAPPAMPPLRDSAPGPLDRNERPAPQLRTPHAIKSPAAANGGPTASLDRRSRRRAVSASGPPDAPPSPPLDLNRATEAELVQLPGVGRVLAARILAAREAAGRFRSVDDLRGVPGLGGGRFESLRRLLITAS